MTLEQADWRSAVLIMAMSRTGSNIVINVVGSSPAVQTAGEMHTFYQPPDVAPLRALRRAAPWFGERLYDALFDEAAFREGLAGSVAKHREWKTQLLQERGIDLSGQSHIAFKIMHPLTHLTGRVARCFDDVKVIGLVRDGLAACDSWMRRGASAENAGRRYAMYARHMRKAEATFGPRFRRVKFEELLADPLNQAQGLLAWLGLPEGEGYLFRPKGYGPGREMAARGEQHRELLAPADYASVFAGEVNDAARQRLKAEDAATFLSLARPAMAQFGYPAE